jgi:hypothetical protein
VRASAGEGVLDMRNLSQTNEQAVKSLFLSKFVLLSTVFNGTIDLKIY